MNKSYGLAFFMQLEIILTVANILLCVVDMMKETYGNLLCRIKQFRKNFCPGLLGPMNWGTIIQ